VKKRRSILLSYPYYKKPFELTTDASAYGMGVVLSQKGRPISMLSRTSNSFMTSKENMVHGDLSRQQLSVIGAQESKSCASPKHSEVSLTHTRQPTNP